MRAVIAPKPDRRLGFARCSYDSARGLYESGWEWKKKGILFQVRVPFNTRAKFILPYRGKRIYLNGRWNRHLENKGKILLDPGSYEIFVEYNTEGETQMFGENHAHIFMNALDYHQAVKDHEKAPDERIIRAHFKAYQEKQVSFVRDGGDHLHVSYKAREIAPEYGIDYRTPIFAIHKNGHYGGIVGRGFDTMKEYAALVKEVRREGGDFIKIMTTGIMDFDTDGSITGTALSFGEVREMVHIAHEEGFCVMSHTNGARAVKEAAAAGADSIEHGNYVDEEAVEVMAEMGTVWVPTITVVKNLIGKGRFSDQVLEKIWEKGKKNIRRGYEAGVNLALGSDAGAYLVPHGQGILDEWACFQEILGDKGDLEQRLLKGESLIQGKFRKV